MRTAILLGGLLVWGTASSVAQEIPNQSSSDLQGPFDEHLLNQVLVIESEVERLNGRRKVLTQRENRLKELQPKANDQLVIVRNLKDAISQALKEHAEISKDFETIDARKVRDLNWPQPWDDVPEDFSPPYDGPKPSVEDQPGAPSIEESSSSSPAPPVEAPAVPADNAVPVPALDDATNAKRSVFRFASQAESIVQSTDADSELNNLRAIHGRARRLLQSIFDRESELQSADFRITQIATTIEIMLAAEQGRTIRASESFDRAPESTFGSSSYYEEVRQTLADAKSMLSSLEYQRRNAEGSATSLVNRIVGLLETTSTELSDIDRQRTQLDQNLAKAVRDAHEQRGIDSLLNWAIILMIVCMVLLYCSLLVFRQDLADVIIEKRTLLELLSMGFLMLTVIILGTGKLLEVESLAALLGTIAGYIFGRRILGEDDDDV